MNLTSKTVPTEVETITITACIQCRFRSPGPTATCPLCAEATERRPVQTTGTVWSHTLVHLPHGANTNGYRLVYVDLDDGPRVLCQKAADEPSVKVDDRVRISPGDDDIYVVKEVVA
jgi:uncharacterized OB-fold protein